MDKKFKARWLRALKSGRYEKGEGRLCRLKKRTGYQHDRFCCLGVAMELLKVPYPADSGTMVGDGRSCYEVLGIDARQEDDLVSLNDQNNTFTPVIKYIEKNL